MTIVNEYTKSHRKIETYNTYQKVNVQTPTSPLMMDHRHHEYTFTNTRSKSLFRNLNPTWIPPRQQRRRLHEIINDNEEDSSVSNPEAAAVDRQWRRRLFLLITEPQSSLGSAIFYGFLITAIFMSNMIMIMQTMDSWQFIPKDCQSCGGDASYMFEDDGFVKDDGIECVCPPAPVPSLTRSLDYIMYFLTVEWFLRILLFVPAYNDDNNDCDNDDDSDDNQNKCSQQCGRCSCCCLEWFGYLTSASTMIDALGIFPYYMEFLPTTFVSLRLVRIFRIFQLVRLGQYNEMFISLTNVFQKSIKYLRLLLLILAFGATFFGSMVYWLEKGTWKYHAESGSYRFLRVGIDGETEEPTPFRSIPTAFWWFFVTATTVGYGDYYPTTTAGKWCATFAMLMGVLVIAFPVSVFSDLWSHELRQVKGFESLVNEDDGDETNNETENNVMNMNNNDNALAQGKSTKIPPLPDIHHDRPVSDGLYRAMEGHPHHHHHHRSGTVVMDKEDLRTIVECIYNIQENQRQLKAILRKYHNEDLL